MNLESANLILRTSSVPVGENKDANITNITWRNINLRVVLGKSLYERYNKFKICCTSIGNVNTSNFTNYADRLIYITMKGLQFINQTYETTTNTNDDSVIIANVAYGISNGFSLNYTGEIGYVFQKPKSDLVDINIFLRKTSNDSMVTTLSYGESVYCFAIYGIEE